MCNISEKVYYLAGRCVDGIKQLKRVNVAVAAGPEHYVTWRLGDGYSATGTCTTE